VQQTRSPIPFERAFDARYGEAVAVSAQIRRVLARNPSPFTFKGTGTMIVGHGRVAVIDPGPDEPEHLAALKHALAKETVTHILVTHTHRDHSPAARALKEWTGAKTYAFGPHPAADPDRRVAVEEGGDRDFIPEVAVRDGDVIEAGGLAIECVHTPGHISNHMCYALRNEKALFCGDHVMAWSTSVIAPPDGDMADYLASLRKLLDRDEEIYWPTHGGPVRDPKPFVAAYLAHRLEREEQVLACLAGGIGSIAEMTARIYAGLDPRLRDAASLSLLAHLQKLLAEGRATADRAPSLAARFTLARIQPR
jgi:glyoxylase-like metal-dependent hydrolase (beta-lactamase superfamily II)